MEVARNTQHLGAQMGFFSLLHTCQSEARTPSSCPLCRPSPTSWVVRTKPSRRSNPLSGLRPKDPPESRPKRPIALCYNAPQSQSGGSAMKLLDRVDLILKQKGSQVYSITPDVTVYEALEKMAGLLTQSKSSRWAVSTIDTTAGCFSLRSREMA